MSSLYEINEQILDCIDIETGEVINMDRLADLQFERDAKIENVGLWYKNLMADAEAYKREKEVFAERERVARNKAESLKAYLASALGGEKFKTTRVAMSYRKSEAVSISNEVEFVAHAVKNGLSNLLIYKSPVPDKTAIKMALKGGLEIDGVCIEQRQSLQIK